MASEKEEECVRDAEIFNDFNDIVFKSCMVQSQHCVFAEEREKDP